MKHITNLQIAAIIFVIISSNGSVGISHYMSLVAKNGAWITLMITALLFAIGVRIIIALHNRYPKMVLMDYGKLIVGKYPTTIIGIIYLVYFFASGVFVYSSTASLLQSDFLLDTPLIATLITMTPLFAYISSKGFTNIGRLCLISASTLFIVFLSLYLFMFFDGGHLESVLPLIIKEDFPNYIFAVKDAIIPFLGIEVLTVIPFTKQNKNRAGRYASFAVLAVGIFYILNVEGCYVMLGMGELPHYVDSLIVAMRETYVPFLDVLSRLDIFYLTFGFMGSFITMSVIYATILEYACKLLPKISRGFLSAMIGVSLIVASYFTARTHTYGDWLNPIIMYMGLGAAFLIPFLLLVISKVKHHEN